MKKIILLIYELFSFNIFLTLFRASLIIFLGMMAQPALKMATKDYKGHQEEVPMLLPFTKI